MLCYIHSTVMIVFCLLLSNFIIYLIFLIKGDKYNVRVSTQSYTAPELLIENQYYDYAIDMWSLGALFAGIIFKKIPFFPGQNLTDQLLVIANVLGTNDLFLYLKKHNLSLPHKFNGLLRKDNIHNTIIRKPWSYFMNEFNKDWVTNDAIDLVSKILRYVCAFSVASFKSQLCVL